MLCYTVRMGRTVCYGGFEWDEDKARENLKKHGVSFEDAARAFFDPHFFDVLDEEHSTANEQRYVGYGVVHDVLVVATVFTERERVRIISARRATKKERMGYYGRANYYRNGN